MKQALESMTLPESSTIELVDIDKFPVLKQRYNDRIPVLFADGVEICQHKLNKKRLLRYLNSEK